MFPSGPLLLFPLIVLQLLDNLMSHLTIDAKRAEEPIIEEEYSVGIRSPAFSIIPELSDTSGGTGSSVGGINTPSRKGRSFSEGASTNSLMSIKSGTDITKDTPLAEIKKSNLNPYAEEPSKQSIRQMISASRSSEKTSRTSMLEHGSHISIATMLQDISSSPSSGSVKEAYIPRTTSFDRSYNRRASIGVISSGNIEIERWEHKPDVEMMQSQISILQEPSIDDNKALPSLKKIWGEITRHETIPSYADTLFEMNAVEVLNNLTLQLSTAQSHAYLCALFNYIVSEAGISH